MLLVWCTSGSIRYCKFGARDHGDQVVVGMEPVKLLVLPAESEMGLWALTGRLGLGAFLG
jgi:hypothetical protein